MKIVLITACALLCSLPANAEFLQGYVTNEYGRIGVQVSPTSGRINRVYPVSPARDAGLREGDRIISADGQIGPEHADGMAGTLSELVVERRMDGHMSSFVLHVLRVPRAQVRNRL